MSFNATITVDSSFSNVVSDPAWARLKKAVEKIRPWQGTDGSIDLLAEGVDESTLRETVEEIVVEIRSLSRLAPHDAAYHAALVDDLRNWGEQGFGVPDFLDSLVAFDPASLRQDGRQHFVVFPMYTQNGNSGRNLEALAFRMVWPQWLAEIEERQFNNPMFCGITFEDFTPGYDSNSAVFFPETVSVRSVPEKFTWGGIFCDREAARFRRVMNVAVDVLHLDLPPDAVSLLGDQRRCEEAFVLWDLIHDRAHSRGDLPFDPFMIKQRQPFWMYGLEELRCDLTAFRAAMELEAEGVAQAVDVQYAVLLDRMLRFPVTGGRVRNYDGLGGQLLFAYLHRHGAVGWTDNSLRIDWIKARTSIAQLLDEIETLYREGINRPKLVHWMTGHDLVAEHLVPHPASRWAQPADALDLAAPQRSLIDAVLPDEFPLSMFFEALAKQLRDVIESTSGITRDEAA